MPRQYSIGMVPICGKVPDKCRRLATERGDLIHASHLERKKGPARVALDVKLDRPTADFAVFDVRRLVCGQIDERLEALAAIRAPHRHELLERDARGGASRLPHRLEAVEPIDARLVETGRSEEHTSELQSPLNISYAVF